MERRTISSRNTWRRARPLLALTLVPVVLLAAPPSANASPTEAPTGTAQLIARLAEITASMNPQLCYNRNLERADLLRAAMASAPPEQRGPLRFQYANELLNGGRTEAAIEELEALLADIGVPTDAPIPPQVRAIFEILAVAYMRLGEQENCVLNHTSDSCLFPIQGNGVHQLPRGSRGAIAIYERLLASDPNDLQSRYLLNLAHMTLGQYPDSVPAAWLIPLDGVQPRSASHLPGHSFPRFLDLAPAAGVAVTGLSGGCAIEDFDGDGLLDIFATAYGPTEQMRFFVNRGDGSFEDRTEAAGLLGLTGGLNVVHADYDNDGRADLLVLRDGWLGPCGARPNSLLRNLGGGRFEDVTFAAGLSSERPTQTAAWGDFDGDGWLDLFIGNESRRDPGGAVVQDYPCELFHNDGDGTFTEVAVQFGLDVRELVKGVTWGDADGDGWPDLYVSVLGGDNRLYMNRKAEGAAGNRDATMADAHDAEAERDGSATGKTGGGFGRRFEEVGRAAGVAEPFFSFPTWFFDYDNDGDQDLYVSGYDQRRLGQVGADFGAELLGLPSPAERPRLFRNRGDGTFEDVAPAAGLDDVVYTMGCNFGDVDTDGWLDLYLATGAPDYRSIVPNKMYRNTGQGHFEDVTIPGGFGHVQKGHGIAFGDLDADGDEDVYAVMGGAYEGDGFQNALFANPGFGRSWVTLVVEGAKANRSAIGAEVTVNVRGADGTARSLHRFVNTGGSFGSGSLQLEVGLGDAAAIESVDVTWPLPERTSRRYEGLAIGKAYRLVEDREDAAEVPSATPFQIGAAVGVLGHEHHHPH